MLNSVPAADLFTLERRHFALHPELGIDSGGWCSSCFAIRTELERRASLSVPLMEVVQ